MNKKQKAGKPKRTKKSRKAPKSKKATKPTKATKPRKAQRPKRTPRRPPVIGAPPNASTIAQEREAESAPLTATPERGWEELPDAVEETKVVLLPVNPQLLHVYWEMAAPEREMVGTTFSRLGPRAQPLLRFHDATEPDSASRPSSFDVEIALGAGNWYVHLERSARTYCADLGLRVEGGEFQSLARSNVTETPRAFPSDKVQESYLVVDGKGARAETVTAPVEPFTSPGTSPEALESGWRHSAAGEEARATARMIYNQGDSIPTREGTGEFEGASGELYRALRRRYQNIHNLIFGTLSEDESSGQRTLLSNTKPANSGTEVQQGEEADVLEADDIKIIHNAATGEIERKLAEFHRQRDSERSVPAPGAQPKSESARGTQPTRKRRPDLTELTERSFRAGISSGKKSS